MRTRLILAALAAMPALDALANDSKPSGPSPELSAPVRLEAAGKPIGSGSVGHAAPFVGDFDGDAVPDLLVGQFEGGKLVVYRNEGAAAPKLAAGQDFKVGADLGVIPAG
jgi:hypothetical protein